MNWKDIIKRTARYIIKGVPVVKTQVIVKEMQSLNLFSQKNILITGGSTGIFLPEEMANVARFFIIR